MRALLARMAGPPGHRCQDRAAAGQTARPSISRNIAGDPREPLTPRSRHASNPNGAGYQQRLCSHHRRLAWLALPPVIPWRPHLDNQRAACSLYCHVDRASDTRHCCNDPAVGGALESGQLAQLPRFDGCNTCRDGCHRRPRTLCQSTRQLHGISRDSGRQSCRGIAATPIPRQCSELRERATRTTSAPGLDASGCRQTPRHRFWRMVGRDERARAGSRPPRHRRRSAGAMVVGRHAGHLKPRLDRPGLLDDQTPPALRRRPSFESCSHGLVPAAAVGLQCASWSGPAACEHRRPRRLRPRRVFPASECLRSSPLALEHPQDSLSPRGGGSRRNGCDLHGDRRTDDRHRGPDTLWISSTELGSPRRRALAIGRHPLGP